MILCPSQSCGWSPMCSSACVSYVRRLIILADDPPWFFDCPAVMLPIHLMLMDGSPSIDCLQCSGGSRDAHSGITSGCMTCCVALALTIMMIHHPTHVTRLTCCSSPISLICPTFSSLTLTFVLSYSYSLFILSTLSVPISSQTDTTLNIILKT